MVPPNPVIGGPVPPGLRRLCKQFLGYICGETFYVPTMMVVYKLFSSLLMFIVTVLPPIVT